MEQLPTATEDTVFGAIRIRFETSSIGPADLPRFPYIASVIGHRSIQYTAIIFGSSLAGATANIKSCWPDASIITADVNSAAFQPGDTVTYERLRGVYVTSPHRPWYLSLFANKRAPDLQGLSRPTSSVMQLLNRKG